MKKNKNSGDTRSSGAGTDPWVGKVRYDKGKFYTFTYCCGGCGAQIRIKDVCSGDRVCGLCNRRMAVSKTEV
jgi:hypothetical protein